MKAKAKEQEEDESRSRETVIARLKLWAERWLEVVRWEGMG